MNQWGKQQCIERVKLIPDGSASFTLGMGMNVPKDDRGFGVRSWRYVVVVDNGKIEQWFIEPGIRYNADDDPYGKITPENILDWLENDGAS